MSVALERGMAILEILSSESLGVPISEIAEKLDIPLSAAHRLLSSLVELGYVHQPRNMGDYKLSLKAVSLGLRFLSRNTLVDLARPLLDDLAERSGELSRLGLVDGERLVWVTKALGTKVGLRYDPDNGAVAPLYCTASGVVWLSSKPDEEAIEIIKRQGPFDRSAYGPGAPQSLEEFLSRLRHARAEGYACVSNSSEIGTSAMAAPIVGENGETIGVLTLAGPMIRMTEERMRELAPLLKRAAESLSHIDSRMFVTHA
jgi:IclR family acetate operon transcriptional repressor